MPRTTLAKGDIEGLAGAPVDVPAAGHTRWIICALLFFAATVNYVDRQVIGLLKPTLQAELHWSEIDYSNIVFAFQLAYAMGLLVVGRVMDWLDTRRGFSLAEHGAYTTPGRRQTRAKAFSAMNKKGITMHSRPRNKPLQTDERCATGSA